MQQPPTIQPTPRPGPDYDPMDRIVQDLQNIESFLLRLEMNPKDLTYLHSHLSPILALRRTISQQLDKLSEEPYDYTPERLKKLHKDNEQVFTYLEGAVGSMDPLNEHEFKRFLRAAGKTLSDFDGDLTP